MHGQRRVWLTIAYPPAKDFLLKQRTQAKLAVTPLFRLDSHPYQKGNDYMGTWPTLLGLGDAAVLGLPKSFSLTKALSNAKQIRLATAFAHRSGWDFFKEPIHVCKAKVFLLTGRDCYQTEPKLLKEWLHLKATASGRIEARLASDETFFHPKVLIVSYEHSERDFAVVGSGNLSKGGLSANTECSLFINDGATVTEAVNWFDIEFKKGHELNDNLIGIYEDDYKRNKDRRTFLTKRDVETGKKLKVASEATMARWNEAITTAKKYFATKDFETNYAKREAGADEINKVLSAPDFDFDKNGWYQFYKIGSLGQLDERSRDKIWKKQKRFKEGLRKLAIDNESALSTVLNQDGVLHVPGAGLNTISKILAAYARDKWPVYNSRVAVALADFGYKHPHRATTADKYVAYRNLMQKFAEACAENGKAKPNALALDAFFYMRSEQVKKKAKGKKK